VAIELLARVNNRNVTDIGYQALLRTSITVNGALLVSLQGCSVSGMSLGLNISIIESKSEGIQAISDHADAYIKFVAMHSSMCDLKSYITN
jgi:hypothetical protein